jgi:hypothetical protein
MRIFISHSVLLFGLLISISVHSQTCEGRILEESLKPLPGAIISNTRTNEIVNSDAKGDFNTLAQFGDTLNFRFVGYTDEYRIFKGEKLNIILMDKQVNCLGAVWTKRQWKKASKIMFNFSPLKILYSSV